MTIFITIFNITTYIITIFITTFIISTIFISIITIFVTIFITTIITIFIIIIFIIIFIITIFVTIFITTFIIIFIITIFVTIFIITIFIIFIFIITIFNIIIVITVLKLYCSSSSSGIILCKMVNFVEKVSITVSFLHLGALAFDRFLVVFYPCRSMVSIKSSKITIAVIWGLSVIYWGPILYFGGLRTKNGALSCGVRKFTPNWEFWYLPFIILIFGNLFVILLLYVLVALKLWLRKLPGHQTYSINKRVDRSKRRMAKMVTVIVFAFYVCFLPYGIGWVGCSYLKTRPKAICNHWYKFINILVMHLNCAINPVICLVFNLQYRLEWKLALRDPFGLRVNVSRMHYRRRKSSTTMMTIGILSNSK
ncbi:hypothetical protein QZH41_002802 [Actinostola sp. cb2023]|nr:hypothetical protein QZH41_002802 [Actinostola sp. cb2023]